LTIKQTSFDEFWIGDDCLCSPVSNGQEDQESYAGKGNKLGIEIIIIVKRKVHKSNTTYALFYAVVFENQLIR
jgi:hypothetical protein